MKTAVLILTCWISLTASEMKAATYRIHSNIQSCIDKCKNGDTIFVESGIYREPQIIVNKSICLLGRNYPVLDGRKAIEVMTIKAGNVQVKGFTIRNSGTSSMQDLAGIRILNSSDVTIENNRFENTFFGIYSQFTSRCIIRNNFLSSTARQEQSSGNGIHCWRSDSLLIEGNNVRGHRDGIYFEFVTHSMIRKNYSHNNLRYGLHFMFSNNDQYLLNTFSENGSGVAVMFSHHVTMTDNRFLTNWGDAAYGILLKEISDGEIQGNLFENNTSAIYMEGANRILVQKNQFKNNGWGIKIQSSCLDVTVNSNNFSGNTFDISTNGTLQQNNFTGNYWDKYEGYDLDKNRHGDVPYHPVSLFSMIVEKYPAAMLMFRSFTTNLLDRTEKLVPGIIPENLVDNSPLMKPMEL